MLSANVLQSTILVCWLILLIYWLVNAFGTKKIQEEASGPANYWNKALLIGGAMLIGSFFQIDQKLGLTGLIIPRSAVIGLLSLVLVIAGLGVALWARRVLSTNWSATVTIKQEHELITSGPYKFVRHPIYTGILAMILGTALAIGTSGAVVGLALTIAALWIKLRLEERLMTRHFPEKYASYQRETKALIPGLL